MFEKLPLLPPASLTGSQVASQFNSNYSIVVCCVMSGPQAFLSKGAFHRFSRKFICSTAIYICSSAVQNSVGCLPKMFFFGRTLGPHWLENFTIRLESFRLISFGPALSQAGNPDFIRLFIWPRFFWFWLGGFGQGAHLPDLMLNRHF